MEGTEKSKYLAAEKSREARTENSAELQREMKKKKTFDTTLTDSEAVEPEQDPEVEVLKSVVRKHCLVRDSSVNDLEKEYVHETGSGLTQKGNMILVSPPCSTGGARGE